MIGLGNLCRGDDGAGLLVARRLAGRVPAGVDVLELDGEPAGLLTAGERVEAAWLVDAADAVRAATPAGTILRFDAGVRPLPAPVFAAASTHAIGLAEALEIARALGRLPEHTVVYAIAGREFGAGDVPCRPVEAAAGTVADAIRVELARYRAASRRIAAARGSWEREARGDASRVQTGQRDGGET